jgi:hypothetical protein
MREVMTSALCVGTVAGLWESQACDPLATCHNGLRIVIHEELTKFVDNYKQSQRSSNQTSPQRRPSNPAPRHGVASVTSITLSSS